MKPTITASASGYLFSWAEYDISIKVNRLHTGRDASVSGEITIFNESSTIYPPTKLNFTADRTRASLAKTLTEKNGKIPWATLIDQLCYGVQDRVRQGQPVKELWTSNEIAPPRYLLEPLIIENYPNVIFGDPSAYKSSLAIMLLQVLQLPWHDNPFGLDAPSESIKTLYLDWETDEATILWQTTQLARSMGMGALPINYRRCDAPLIDDVEAIREAIEKYEARVIIIDSLGMAAGGELKETKTAIDFNKGIRQLNTTSLILAHNSKDRETKQRTIYGNQYFQAQARNIWEIRKNQESDSNELSIALFHRKPPPFSKMHSPIGFRLSFQDNGLYTINRSAQTITEFRDQLNTGSQVLDLLKEGTQSVKGMANALDIKESTIRVALTRLKNKSLIVKLPDGKWGLMSKQDNF